MAYLTINYFWSIGSKRNTFNNGKSTYRNFNYLAVWITVGYFTIVWLE